MEIVVFCLNALTRACLLLNKLYERYSGDSLLLHDERLLTLEDTVEFFNLILSTKLTPEEKEDLVAFLRAL